MDGLGGVGLGGNSLVPRPHPAFRCFQYRKAAMESWGGGHENEAKGEPLAV